MKRVVLIGSLSLLLASCASYRLDQKAKDTTQEVIKQADTRKSEIDQRLHGPKNDEVDEPYFAGRSIPIAKRLTLPSALRKGVRTALLFRDSKDLSLPIVGERITLATGIPVRIKPDVFIQTASLIPNRGGSSGAGSTAGSAAPQRASAGAAGTLEGGFLSNVDLPQEEIELPKLLDLISTRLGIYWRYEPTEGTIIFYRLTTLTRSINIAPIKGNYKASLGSVAGTSGSGGTSGTTFSNDSRTELEVKESKPFDNIVATVKAMATSIGKVDPVPETSTIVYTDTKEAVDAASAYLDTQNRLLSLKAGVRVRVVRAVVGDQGDSDLDLSVIYSKMSQISPTLTFNNAPIPTVSTFPVAGTGSTGLTFSVRNNPQGGTSRLNGSDVFIQAVATQTKSVTVTEVVEVIPNYRTVASTNANKFSYVSEATPAPASLNGGSSSGGAVGLKTSQEATGLVVSMGAVITDENSMSIELSFADSTLRSLTRENSGQGAFVQNPNIDIFGLLRSIRLQSGETALVTMLRRDVDQSTKRRLGDSWVPLLFGGSDTVKTERQVIFLLVEGVIEG